ncbi:MAG: cob(I)yrinic acid a,c-diamide adenosyltransferase [Pseudomonadota bacterium]|nr:cob(I)yrinic acid a,c-diamide adenosyltransferase [Pseudomonadota bacterium]
MKFSKKGDGGETSLLGGQRVPKYDPRPEAYGVLDEASSALGVARAMTDDRRIGEIILGVQKDLLTMGAELSSLPEDVPKLGVRIGAADARRLEDLIDELQQVVKLKKEFIYPGEKAVAAQIDVGRTIVRRSERKVALLKREGLVDNPHIHEYLNRLADMLFVLARYDEQRGGV